MNPIEEKINNDGERELSNDRESDKKVYHPLQRSGDQHASRRKMI